MSQYTIVAARTLGVDTEPRYVLYRAGLMISGHAMSRRELREFVYNTELSRIPSPEFVWQRIEDKLPELVHAGDTVGFVD